MLGTSPAATACQQRRHRRRSAFSRRRHIPAAQRHGLRRIGFVEGRASPRDLEAREKKRGAGQPDRADLPVISLAAWFPITMVAAKNPVTDARPRPTRAIGASRPPAVMAAGHLAAVRAALAYSSQDPRQRSRAVRAGRALLPSVTPARGAGPQLAGSGRGARGRTCRPSTRVGPTGPKVAERNVSIPVR